MEVCSDCGKRANEVKSLAVVSATNEPVRYTCNFCHDKRRNATKTVPAPKAALPEPLRVPPVREILNHLDGYVVGQTAAKHDVAVAVHRHYMVAVATAKEPILLDGEVVRIQKSNILMAGPSGTGKTALIRAVTDLLRVPYHQGDATRLTQAGYVGDSVDSLLQGLIVAAQGDPKRAETGVIFLDEVDKLARKSGRDAAGYRDVGGEGVQQSLLKMLEGHTFHIPRGMGSTVSISSHTGQAVNDVVDTRNVLFVCAGSFAGIESIVERRIHGKSRVGFSAAPVDAAPKSSRSAYEDLTVDDLLEFGLIPEFIGRLPVLTSTLPLSTSDMVRILTEPRDALVKQVRALWALGGVAVTFTDAALGAIAEEAQKNATGARALHGVVERVMRPFYLAEHSDAICVTDQTVQDHLRGGGVP